MNATTQPRQIAMPAAGLALTEALLALGLTFDRVNPLLGDELGAPRDYSMPRGSGRLVFTETGVRNLARLFDIPIELTVEKLAPVDAPPMPASAPVVEEPTTDAHGRARGPWWKREDSE